MFGLPMSFCRSFYYFTCNIRMGMILNVYIKLYYAIVLVDLCQVMKVKESLFSVLYNRQCQADKSKIFVLGVLSSIPYLFLWCPELYLSWRVFFKWKKNWLITAQRLVDCQIMNYWLKETVTVRRLDLWRRRDLYRATLMLSRFLRNTIY